MCAPLQGFPFCALLVGAHLSCFSRGGGSRRMRLLLWYWAGGLVLGKTYCFVAVVESALARFVIMGAFFAIATVIWAVRNAPRIAKSERGGWRRFGVAILVYLSLPILMRIASIAYAISGNHTMSAWFHENRFVSLAVAGALVILGFAVLVTLALTREESPKSAPHDAEELASE